MIPEHKRHHLKKKKRVFSSGDLLLQLPAHTEPSQYGSRIWINIYSLLIQDISFQTLLIYPALIKLLNFVLAPKISSESYIHALSHFKRPDCRL